LIISQYTPSTLCEIISFFHFGILIVVQVFVFFCFFVFVLLLSPRPTKPPCRRRRSPLLLHSTSLLLLHPKAAAADVATVSGFVGGFFFSVVDAAVAADSSGTFVESTVATDDVVGREGGGATCSVGVGLTADSTVGSTTAVVVLVELIRIFCLFEVAELLLLRRRRRRIGFIVTPTSADIPVIETLEVLGVPLLLFVFSIISGVDPTLIRFVDAVAVVAVDLILE
jgi:hypothetical protein